MPGPLGRTPSSAPASASPEVIRTGRSALRVQSVRLVLHVCVRDRPPKIGVSGAEQQSYRPGAGEPCGPRITGADRGPDPHTAALITRTAASCA